MKTFWFDVETTGLDPKQHEIIQFSAITEVDGKPTAVINIKMRPDKPELISEQALVKQKRTVEEIQCWPAREEGFKKILEFLNAFVDRYDRNDKCYMAGYNVQFDRNFLESLFKEFNDDYMFSYFWWEMIDVMQLAMIFKLCGAIEPKKMRLVEVAQAVGIDFSEDNGAHDALMDIRCTRALFYKLESAFDIDPSKLGS